MDNLSLMESDEIRIGQLTLNLRNRTYRYTKGFLTPNVLEGSFDDFEGLEFCCEERSEDKSTYTVRVIYLLWRDGKKVNIGASSDEVEAHRNLESFAEKLNLRIYDKTGAETIIIEPSELDLSLREKVRQRGESEGKKGGTLSNPPQGAKTSHAFERGIHHFVLPRGGFNLFVIVFLVVFSCFWNGFLFFASKELVIERAPLTIDKMHFPEGAPILGLLCLIPFYATGIAMALLFLYMVLAQTHLLVSPQSVTMYTAFLGRKWHQKTVSTDKIEEIKLEQADESSNFSLEKRQEVTIRTDEMYLKFGKHLKESEKEWLVESIKSIILA